MAPTGLNAGKAMLKWLIGVVIKQLCCSRTDFVRTLFQKHVSSRLSTDNNYCRSRTHVTLRYGRSPSHFCLQKSHQVKCRAGLLRLCSHTNLENNNKLLQAGMLPCACTCAQVMCSQLGVCKTILNSCCFSSDHSSSRVAYFSASLVCGIAFTPNAKDSLQLKATLTDSD